ncbi:MAG TPA: VWA domain-containing protein [Pyrinomonadaceae bacterium]|nr:VWA domain-containing protein [Pyrinomonadaceae bacterium]
MQPKTIKSTTLLIALILATLVPALGQSSLASPQQEPIVVSSNLVTVNVIVTDKNGRYVKGLRSDQFSIYDENARQKISHFSVGSGPVSIGIVYEVRRASVIQVSASLAALKQFVAALREGDNFFFTAYSVDGSVTTEFIPSANQVIEHLSTVKPGGPSALYDVMYSAAERLRQSPNLKRALLVISDGQDDHSQHSYVELRNRLREFDAQIYTIGIADSGLAQFEGYRRWVFEDLSRPTGRRAFLLNAEADMGRAVLGEIARVSGGTAYTPETESEPELTGICTQIALELREQYTLGFYPSDVSSKKWHRIKVRVNRPESSSGFSLSYRKGYQRRPQRFVAVFEFR